MKIYIRTLWGNRKSALWDNPDQREGLRQYLNDLGFYTLTGMDDSLEVSVTEYSEPIDVRLAKKSLDRIQKLWYSLLKINGGIL